MKYVLGKPSIEKAKLVNCTLMFFLGWLPDLMKL